MFVNMGTHRLRQAHAIEVRWLDCERAAFITARRTLQAWPSRDPGPSVAHPQWGCTALTKAVNAEERSFEMFQFLVNTGGADVTEVLHIRYISALHRHARKCEALCAGSNHSREDS